ncbi:MAG: methyltransferase domain-containing protein [Acidobacteria bacterium]|nr:methyltransferase domain-containing protein [Acidobacteriota bacterium]
MTYQHDAMMRDESMSRSLHFQAACIWPLERNILAAWPQRGARRVLDLGCGTGIITSRLGQECGFNDVTGVDVIEDRIHQAQQRWHDQPGLQFELVDEGPLPFPDKHFDLVINRHVLQVIPDPAAMIMEMVRVSSKGLYFLAEDYGMLHHMHLPSCKFWLDSAVSAQTKHTDLLIGRRLPQLLIELGLKPNVQYLSIDTINTPREYLIEMFKAWRDGYAAFLAEINEVPLERALAHFNQHIDICNDPHQYLVWHVPIVQCELAGT